ncbi:hypothetical protein PQX77_006692 [Marasmius sp. AFHP31]|nr:hypothetical protein PQX77_006692 [Marasmius sp. AFHP31]
MRPRTFIGEGYGDQPKLAHSYNTVVPDNHHASAHPRSAYSASSSTFVQSTGHATPPMMLSGGQYAPQHGQTIDAGYYDPSTRGGTFPGAVAYPEHPYYSPHPATGALDIAEDDHTPAPVLGIDISIADVDSQLRRLYNIPPNHPVDLNAIPDLPVPPFTQIAITQFAIWSSKHRRLTQAEIWSRIEERFPWVRNPETAKKWKANIRHHLSLKKTFLRLPESRNGASYWTLDYRYLESGGDKRERKRGTKKKSDTSDARRQHQSDDEYDTEESRGDLHLREECYSSSSPPSSGTGSGPLTYYEQVPYGSHSRSSGHPFNPSHHPALPQRMSSGGSQHSRPVDRYPPASHASYQQPSRNQTYPLLHSPEPVFGQSSFMPNHQSSNLREYR